MHMPNELLSVPVAGGCFAVAAAGVSMVCRAASKSISHDKIPLMGIFGAFIFAAQMVNFPLPIGASGHMTGAVFLAIVFGPAVASVIMTSVVVVQCLIFQDGGLLALGCNVINLALVPSFVGYAVYSFILKHTSKRIYTAAIAASIIAMLTAAGLVSIQTAISGVIVIPFSTFLSVLCGVHLIIGIVEGLITASLLCYLHKVRPDVIPHCLNARPGLSKPAFILTMILAVIVTGTCLSLVASEKPDGLEYTIQGEWSKGDSPVIENNSPAVTTADNVHSKIAPLPDYTLASNPTDEQMDETQAKGWTSFAAVLGSILVMSAVWLISKLIKTGERSKCTTP